ncbi:HlyD family type I secretion periplasmic adaptor subunit [Aliiruegeria sabulilitoris]|uniref:HlyD family type I secretion periplasmic adaptor subunit n=1 Tax=Aliiruegeria sabulilitoris TaxID=1510458 RepID=UPI000830398E|nr:HlyD family type I secretion periplasmic adaptor subunit [Aliiruegeria sabulilitoris]NDR55585.1 HlyD family type I secretion periplasmic adaptor subunit [Pseudoruegeria sp. M32A2M]
MNRRNRLSARFPLWLGLISIALLLGGFGSWSLTSRIAGAVVASGHVEVDQHRQVVQHLDGGIVKRLLVQEGDRVQSGQKLIELEDSEIRSELTIVEGQVFELMARAGRFEAERDGAQEINYPAELLAAASTRSEIADLVAGQTRLFQARLGTLQKKADQLARRRQQIESQVDGIDAQRTALTEQLSLIGQELQDQQHLLDKGLAQASRVLSLQRERSGLAGSLGELAASRAETLGRMTEMDIEILKLETDRREEAISQLRDLKSSIVELNERRHSLGKRLSRLEIAAPAAGIVHGLVVNTPRSVIRAADPVAYIVPQDRPLVITARIDPLHVDEVFVGQEVTLRFPAFDSRRTPELAGRVFRISADAFSDERSGQSFYRCEIVLDEDEIKKLGEGKEVLPGMPVEAYIRTGERSPLAYLVKPFTDYFNKAFRES